MKLSDLVAKYIELRDKKYELKHQYDFKAAQLDEMLGKIEAKLLQVFDTAGMDSVKTEFGTAYASTRSTASVADKETFMNFIKENEEWSLMEVRAAKLAIEQYKTANGDLPPGVNYREERVVNIRRSQ
jgi:5'-3' exonuclease